MEDIAAAATAEDEEDDGAALAARPAGLANGALLRLRWVGLPPIETGLSDAAIHVKQRRVREYVGELSVNNGPFAMLKTPPVSSP